MYEFERFEYEFSKVYKRLLRLELLIKNKIINCALSVYKNNAMATFKKFFNNPHIYKKYNSDSGKNTFLEIRDNKTLIDAIKFEQIINLLTLRHLLHFISTEEAFKVKEIAENFYAKDNVNFKELKKAKISLINLRNYIAHFNFKEYQDNKSACLHSLLLYEICIGCSLGKYDGIPNNLGQKPNMTTIIERIYELAPELFRKDLSHSSFPYNKDRMIVDMYEDIAVLNGWEYSELKSQWDVIRKKYDFNKQKALSEGIQNLDTEEQLNLFDTIDSEGLKKLKEQAISITENK